MRATTVKRWWGAAVLAALLLPGGAATGQPAAPAVSGVTVEATGAVEVMPARAEMNTWVTADAEVAADAMVKFRDAKTRALAALKALDLGDGVRVEEGGVELAAPMSQQQMNAMWNPGMGNIPMKPNVQVSERLTIVWEGFDPAQPQPMLETLTRIMDALRDAGLGLGDRPPANSWEMNAWMQRGGGGGAVGFRITDPEAVRKQAFAKAMQDARQRAGQLAELAGARLGRVVAIQELPPERDQAFNPYLGLVVRTGSLPGGSDRRSPLAAQTVSVRLTVTFALEDKP